LPGIQIILMYLIESLNSIGVQLLLMRDPMKMSCLVYSEREIDREREREGRDYEFTVLATRNCCHDEL